MYNLAARKFAFVSTGPIGCCPQQRKNSSSADCNARTNSISSQYGNGVASLLAEMKSEVGDMSYSFFNSSSTLMEYIESPDAYGLKTYHILFWISRWSLVKKKLILCMVLAFTEVKAACCGIGDLNAVIACLPVSRLCHNRTGHIFWDLYHPTEAHSCCGNSAQWFTVFCLSNQCETARWYSLRWEWNLEVLRENCKIILIPVIIFFVFCRCWGNDTCHYNVNLFILIWGHNKTLTYSIRRSSFANGGNHGQWELLSPVSWHRRPKSKARQTVSQNNLISRQHFLLTCR